MTGSSTDSAQYTGKLQNGETQPDALPLNDFG